jgi:hypothetical protein
VTAGGQPVLSVVLTVVDGGDALRRCLVGLLSQQDPPAMEIIVPFDATQAVGSIADLVAGPGAIGVRTLDLGRIETRRSPRSPGGQHELIDRRRAAGLAAARGAFVAIVEDRGVPRPDWAATIVRLHKTLPNLVIGGAIENGRDRLLNWAVYYCDFGRYQRPFPAGPRRDVSDVNVAYKRRALDLTREIWRDRFHEPLVHHALQGLGESLFASPDLVVDQMRDDVSLLVLFRERFAWGRLFGSLRARDASLWKRLAWVAGAPLVPLVLFARTFRDRLTRGTSKRHFLAAAPIVAVLFAVWAAGEAAGSFSAEARP